MNRLALLVPLLLTLVLTAGCQSIENKKIENNLTTTLSAYHTAVRWGYPGEAYNFLDPAIEADPADDPVLNMVRVTRYKVLRPAVEVAKNQMIQTVAIQYIYTDRQIQKSMIDNQLWHYNEDVKKWLRANPIPKYK